MGADRSDDGAHTARGTGRPHRNRCWVARIDAGGGLPVTGIGAMCHDGAVWFETGKMTRKGRNSARDPVAP